MTVHAARPAGLLENGAGTRAMSSFGCVPGRRPAAAQKSRPIPKRRSTTRQTGHSSLRMGTCMEALLELNGVGVPTASTLLHFAFPDDYPILDVRALESLGVKARTQYPVSFWLGYLRACRELSMGCGVSVRTLDKALWQHSKNAQTPCGWSRSRRVRLAARDGVATERRKSPRNQLEAHAGRGATAAEDGGLREMCGNSYRGGPLSRSASRAIQALKRSALRVLSGPLAYSP